MHKRPHFLQKRARKHRTNSAEADDDLSSFFLSKPKTDHLDLENQVFPCGIEAGHASMQGFRAHMEDRHIIAACDIQDHILVAVFDGEWD
ncbi:hypothetical protein EON63_13185 [archaeon]|nr:MAG: hypothetical protein EON63_13185 [archaeon]